MAKGRAKLTAAERAAIYREAAAGVRQKELAARYGVTASMICVIANSQDERPDDRWDPHQKLSESDRCPGCGRMVYVWPCLECTMG